MPAGQGFIVQAILGMMGSQSLLHVGALSIRLSEGFLVLISLLKKRVKVNQSVTSTIQGL